MNHSTINKKPREKTKAEKIITGILLSASWLLVTMLGVEMGAAEQRQKIETLISNPVIVRSSERVENNQYKVTICDINDTCISILRNAPYIVNSMYKID